MNSIILSLCIFQTVLSIDIEDGSSSRDSRKLFGGYKITPKSCKPTRDVPIDLKGPNICMFNHECIQRSGVVVGACMDGFLFGACCRLPDGTAGELVDVTQFPESNMYRPSKPSKVSPTIGEITSHGVSQIANELLNGMIPTAQDDAVVQVDHQQFSTTGVTHPTGPDTIIQNSYNEINPDDFRPKKTTLKFEASTAPTYLDTSPPHFSMIFPAQQRPIFKPKPPTPSDSDKYVLVPTITHTTKPNKTQDYESVVNIIQLLNNSAPHNTASTYIYGASTKKPPSTSYVFNEKLTTQKLSTSYVTLVPSRPIEKITSKKPPSTSYIFSTIPPVKRPPTTQKEPPNYTHKPIKIKVTSKPVTSRPAHSTFANSPDAFVTTKKPPSTSYVFSTTLSKKPATTATPTTHVTTTPPTIYSQSYPITRPSNVYSTYPKPPPTVIVLSPEYTTPTPPLNSQTTKNPQRKPVTQVTINNHITHNIYSTSEKPSPTILITPKPSTLTKPSSDYDAITVEAATSPNDLNNFPPVRNPNLNMSVPVFDESDVNLPQFVEDETLNIKVESFVNKIIQGLQEPFNGLKAVLYNQNGTVLNSIEATTKKPVKNQGTTTRGPTATRLTTRRPSTTKRPSVTTNKRTRPTKKVTTTTVATTTSEIPISSSINQDYRHACGVRPLVKSGRIVGGKGATFGEFPWQVLVRESTWLGLFTKNKCGGVLISNRYVMTAAHCQPGFLASLVAVFGEFDISGDLESKRPLSRNIKRVIVNRLYDAATFENDLALLELEHPVLFDQHIIPICLPREGEDFTGRMATVTGWGRLKYGGSVPSVLQEVQVPIMENHVCQEMFRTAGHSKLILDSFLCAGYANGQKDSCEGDSGGPLVLQRPDGRYQLAGTVSHGIKCAAPYLPGVYMRTSFYKPWIESITGIH